MAYGIIEYNDEGLPKCEICGLHFDRVLSHVRQKHNMSAREYKQKYGFDTTKGICSKNSSKLSRTRALENYDKVIKSNLIINGVNTRFKKNHKGRTYDKLSRQSIIRLTNQITSTKNIKKST